MLPAILSQFPTHFKPLVSFYTPREHQKIRGVMKWAERKVVGSIWQVESIGILSVIKQKGESQKGYFKKTKYTKFSEKQVFLTPWYAHVYVSGGVRNVCFSQNLVCFVFFKHPLRDSPSCLITDNLQITTELPLQLKILVVIF